MSASVKFINLGEDATFLDGLAALKETGAASIKIVVRDANDAPLAAFIVVRGRSETDEFITALDKIEDSWHDDDKATPMIDPPVAYLQGSEAAADGKSDTNPYPAGTDENEEWHDGYMGVACPDE